ncbi:MAG: segregation/condensation protein A [Propionibacteriaceae bacterium]|nr:segregation/condensation protein A [Propionibacteriaceae bacterium]
MSPERPEAEQVPGFDVHLSNFEGPFDLLLQLIAKHKLDITEVALSQVTGEFIAHLKARGEHLDLTQTSSFLLVAATLLDLKAARLLPSGEVEDDEDLAVLEARDLLFARLLQYRAYKQVSVWIARVLADQERSFPRPGGLEPQFREALPELVLDISPATLAALAAGAMAPKPIPVVSLAHLHGSTVSVAEQANVIAARLRRQSTLTFRALIADADTLTAVARFLALLELYRDASVQFEQLTPLGELTIRWTGPEEGEVLVRSDYDEPLPEVGGHDE